ncbi:MAG TPA: MarC family protein [Acetobacteraceae bacterium]|nr:MarC family protein [Acetobacteraceae bacterium]
MTWPLVETFTYAFVALMVIVDPVGTAVVFAAMTPQDTAAERASQARRACLVAFLVLAAFGLAGANLLSAMGIGLPAMRIAGGALLFLTAVEMVADRHALRGTDPEREAALRTDQDIAIFPLAIPLIAGPGAMTTMVVLHSRAGGRVWHIAAIEGAAALTIILTLGALLSARFLSRVLGESGASVAGRVLGVLLAALAVQLAIDGFHEAFPR